MILVCSLQRLNPTLIPDILLKEGFNNFRCLIIKGFSADKIGNTQRSQTTTKIPNGKMIRMEGMEHSESKGKTKRLLKVKMRTESPLMAGRVKEKRRRIPPQTKTRIDVAKALTK